MNTLFLIFHGRYPSNRAASLFAAKSAEAFAHEGVETILIVPRRLGRGTEDPYEYYSVERNFRIIYLPVIDIGTRGVFGLLRFWLSFLTFSFTTFLYLLWKTKRTDTIYSNEWMPLLFASVAFQNTFYEMHDFPESKFRMFGWFLRRIRYILVHNRWKLEQLRHLYDASVPKAICEPNAVDLSVFDLPITKEEARRKLGLSAEGKLVVYTGHLYAWKGVDSLLAAGALLPEDYTIAFVGGTSEDIERFRNAAAGKRNIKIVGHRPHNEIPLWQKAADVLVLPNTAKKKIAAYYTSPMKLFEYMASKRPIVASRLPSILELVDDSSAYLVKPDDAHALAASITDALSHRGKAERLALSAYERVREHTWDKRARRILAFAGFNSEQR